MHGETAVGFLRRGAEVLLVSRGDRTPRRWGGVPVRSDSESEGDRRPTATVGGTDAVTLVRSADPIDVGGTDAAKRTLRPYLFECDVPDPTLDGAITAREWVQPPEMLERETVPGLWDAYLAVAPSVRTVREDDEHGAGHVSLRALETLRDRAAAAAAGGEGYDPVASTARALCRTRPSMGVIRTRVDRVMAEADRTPRSICDRAMEACTAAVRADGAAAERVASLLGERVFTLSRSGTVRAALSAAAPESAFVAESRPAREGIDAAERLAEAGLDVTVLVDAAMEGLLAGGAVESVLVGADAVLADGSVINKIGSRTAMRAGTAAGIDCYAVCSRDKVVPETDFDPEFGPPEAVYAGGADLAVHDPTFERVPPSNVSGIVTEDGVYAPEDVGAVAEEHASYRQWRE